MSTSNRPLLPAITVEAIRALRDELAQNERLLATLPGIIESQRKKLEAALLWIPDALDEASAATPSRNKGNEEQDDVPPPFSLEAAPAIDEEKKRVTWIGEAYRILSEQSAGISYPDLLEKLKQTELGEKPSAGDKGFYAAVARLLRINKAVKFGGLLYTMELYRKLLARGATLPDLNANGEYRRGGSSEMILEVLAKSEGGLTAHEIREALLKFPDAPKSLTEHGQYVYNLLGPMIGRGAVIKDGPKYKLASI